MDFRSQYPLVSRNGRVLAVKKKEGDFVGIKTPIAIVCFEHADIYKEPANSRSIKVASSQNVFNDKFGARIRHGNLSAPIQVPCPLTAHSRQP